MMTEKRFIFNSDTVATNLKTPIVYDNKIMNIGEVLEKLNELSDENEQLKQFQDRVFSWIDMHLQRLPTLRDDEFESDNEFADPSLYSGAIQILETMKRELKGDVE